MKWWLALFLVMAPAIAVVVARVSHEPFIARYVVFAAVGVALVLPLAVWSLSPENSISDVALCLIFAIPFAMDVAKLIRSPPSAVNPTISHTLLLRRLAAHDSVVVSAGVEYLQLWFYLPTDLRDFAIYVADPETELRQTLSDTVDEGYLALARWTRVPVYSYDLFSREHRKFELYACDRDWLSVRIRGDDAAVVKLGDEPDCQLYDVAFADRRLRNNRRF